MDTIARGKTAEGAVLHALHRVGLHVLLPFGGGLAFDLAALTDDGRMLRLQVKSGRVRDGCVLFNSCSTDHGNGRQDYRGKADAIAVYVASLERVFVVPVGECPSYVGSLRLRAPRNSQKRRIRLAENYSIESWARSLGVAAAA
jgi:hypothetical protein